MKNSKKILFVIVSIFTIVSIVAIIMIFGFGDKKTVAEDQRSTPVVVVYSIPEEKGIDANAPTDYYITENGMMIERDGVLVPYEVDRDEFFAFLSSTPTPSD